jgi:methionyl-tRNA formyltransferase
VNTYIVATIKPWNVAAFGRHTRTLPGSWHLISEQADLTPVLIAKLRPRYIFFPHWSWAVPLEILSAAECVCFHMTDVPYGRGGSPLQNLIANGCKDTVLSALRMVPEMDAGPVYLKRPLSLTGRAQDIFERAAELVYDLTREIIEKEPKPVPQKGTPIIFKRRTPDMSVLPKTGNMEDLYDHIRMLDAETYPKAFLEHGDFHLVFDNAELQADGSLKAGVRFEKKS